MINETQKLLDKAISRLKEAGIKNARQETEILFKHVLGNDFYLNMPLSSEQKENLEKAVFLREQRIPIERIFGITEFFGLKIWVENNVFKPYPESEDFVYYAIEAIKETFKEDTPIHILDAGTGTGCLLLALLKELPNAHGTGIDINDAALELAAKNANLNNLGDRVSFIKNDWCEGLKEKFHVVISNPPRAKTGDIPYLLPEMREHDPIISLDGGEDGLEFVKKLAFSFDSISHYKALCLCQIGAIYASEAEFLFKYAGFSKVSIKENFFGQPCCIIASKNM
ncbi:MAG: peptide chain release factor N(5)-glutamine methyltransferase [Alphaproteobacteria bacterium]|nr:peptide chain release factor N(5)-glutamine methyltransferase [Alphaproteobacteria bacterium]